jgi:hypothetical protein
MYGALLNNDHELVINEVLPQVYMRYGDAHLSENKQGAIEKLRAREIAHFESRMTAINWQSKQYGG